MSDASTPTPPPTPAAGALTQAATQPPKETVKETLVSIIIAFALAFVFRSFVIEAFIIPTGSMAPTLLGAHMRFTGELSGADWAVGPWDVANPGVAESDPLPLQGTPQQPVEVHDPITGTLVRKTGVPLRSGDRILVLKYLYALHEPERFDVVVFKNPNNPSVNYIKRLLGLPGECIALVDGDVFRRTAAEADLAVGAPPAAWDAAGWSIARKPAGVQERVWQTVYDTRMAPMSTGTTGALTPSPWVPSKPEAWAIKPGGAMEYRGGGADKAVVNWVATTPFIPRNSGTAGPRGVDREITDRNPYDETRPQRPGMPTQRLFPVGDVRIRAALTPMSAGGGGGARGGGGASNGSPLTVRVILRARGHEFMGRIQNGTAGIFMRRQPSTADQDPAWTDLGSAPCTLPEGELSSIEFAHADQQLTLRVNGRDIAQKGYDWSPAQRIEFATGRPLASLVHDQEGARDNVLANPDLYQDRRPACRLEFEGGPFELRHVALDRDLFYQPAAYMNGLPALATSPLSTLALEEDEFFCCGDNSPASLDGRLWDPPDAWVSALMTKRGLRRQQGVVPRDLMMGKAFFVYFPSLTGGSPLPVPDFGRMRFIR